MADRLPVLFLWHHHQPFYRLPRMTVPVMPWVRLHAVRGYWDMLAAARETGAQMVFNFSPSLLEQLKFAAGAEPADEFERISRTAVAEWSERERLFALEHFFSINWSVHVHSHPRYSRLLSKRGSFRTEEERRNALLDFVLADYLDLTALFNLAWIGFAGRRDPRISELVRKGEEYTADDIATILFFHREIVGSVLDGYRALFEQGQIELSTSPYAHPILPLLLSTDAASPDIPAYKLPHRAYKHPEAGRAHLAAATEVCTRVWGRRVAGVWPSEGSVSEDAVSLIAEAGYSWCATDEGVLKRSELSPGASHFQPHTMQTGSGQVNVYFRDWGLSDAIGFRYSSFDPARAVQEFIGHLENIEQSTRSVPRRCILVALDGENPWEAYPDGGSGFLTGVFSKLTSHLHLKSATIGWHSERNAGSGIVSLHAGSWIDSNFRIWVGDPEKNAAWSELQAARHVLAEIPPTSTLFGDASALLMKAEGSDWMWWYGEPFSSPYEGHFDELFRGYLKAFYQALNLVPPASLDTPIKVPKRLERRLKPAFAIAPVIDGRETSFFEWQGAVKLDGRQFGSTMGRAEHLLGAVWYGFGEREVFLRVDPTPTVRSREGATIHVCANETNGGMMLECRPDASKSEQGNSHSLVCSEIIELAIDRQSVNCFPGGEFGFWVEVWLDGAIQERIPHEGVIRFLVPSAEAMAANWMV